MIKSITKEHLEAVRKKHETKEGLVFRGEYCRFMAATTPPSESKWWAISAEKREREAAAVAV